MVAELAVALVLLTASGLLLRSFQKMRAVDLGFRADHTLTAAYSLPRQQYSTQAAIDAFNLALRTKLEQLPGVQAVGVTTMLPAARGLPGTFTPEGYVASQGSRFEPGMDTAGDGQITSRPQGFRLFAGGTSPRRRRGAPLVVIVNRTLAEHYWPGQDPIGKRLHRGPAEADLPWLTVVGEIGDVKELAADVPTEEQFYIPSSQAKADAGSFATPRHAHRQ